MAPKKGTTNNPNGRKKGVPNKATGDLKAWVSKLLDDNRETILKDLARIEPLERLAILEKLMKYVMPTQQNISVEAQIQAEYRELEVLISKLPDEAVTLITERLISLNQFLTSL